MFHSVLDAKGLYTYANPLGQQSVPGAMSGAVNVNCDQIGITTTRRGFDFYSASKPFSSGTVTKMFGYENTLYVASSLGQFARDLGAGSWSVYGAGFTMSPPSGGFLHQMLAGGNSYFTTSNGIYKLSGVNASAPIPAGAPAGLDTTTYVSTVISSGFLNAKSQCAYSIVWGYTDESNLQVVGAPSSAAYALNNQAVGASNNANVTIVASMPPFVVQNSSLPWFYQIYRTPNTGTGLVDASTVPPGNNYQLVAQVNPTAGDYTNRYVSFADTVLDSLLGAALYTADGQPGVGLPYGQPPLANDAAYFNSMAFYSDYSTLQDALLTLDAVGATAGIQVGDTVAITDSASAAVYTYTGATSTAGTSVSGAAPATTATALSFSVNINGDGAQTVVVDDAGTHTGAQVAAKLQVAIRALTANSVFNQAAISAATAVYTTVYTVTSGSVSATAASSSVVITGAGALTLKLGVANGGTETTGTNANNPTTRTFAIYSSGTPAGNIQQTAQNLVQVINQDPNNTLYTIQYISAFSALPGQMQLFAQNLSQAFFSIISSRTTCWTPTVPSSGTTYASASVTVQNMLAISQVSKPESVPAAFTLPVGSPNFPIGRIIPVRTALIVVKPEEGVFEVTGNTPTTLTVTTLDTTAFISGSETMAALNNSGYFFTTQGVMLVNESGCEIMSRNVQGDILALASSNYPSFSSLAFGIGYQSDNAYILFLQKDPTDTYSTLQYRYNWITQAWTTWDIPCTAAVVNTANDSLYIATPDGYILKERKALSSLDYADETIAVTISAVGTSTLTLADSTNVEVGDEISQVVSGITYTAFVASNNITTGVIGVDSVVGFIVAAASCTKAIDSTISFMPTSCGYPAFIKKFTTWNFEFSNVSFVSCTASFTTDFYPNAESVTLTPHISGLWGQFTWGSNPWGVTQANLQPISSYSTKNTSIGHWTNVTLNLRQAYSGFGLCGYTIFFNVLGERSR
jgi:hypothetical protein